MGLNPTTGGMYADVDFTHNMIKGICPFDCAFCYMKTARRARLTAYKEPLHVVESELKVKYHRDSRVFLGSATDMWMAPSEMVAQVLTRCMEIELETQGTVSWLLQTKDPRQMMKYLNMMPNNVTLGTTLETNYNQKYEYISRAPLPRLRAMYMAELRELSENVPKPIKGLEFMFSVEPIMKFDQVSFVQMANWIHPDYISMGACTYREYKNLEIEPPTVDDTVELVSVLVPVYEVRCKKNLLRLAGHKEEKQKMIEDLRDAGARLTWEENWNVRA